MDSKVTLVLTEKGRENTAIGYEQIDIIDFGYDKDGKLAEVICVGRIEYTRYPPGPYGLFTIGGYIDIFEDLFENYEVAKEEE